MPRSTLNALWMGLIMLSIGGIPALLPLLPAQQQPSADGLTIVVIVGAVLFLLSLPLVFTMINRPKQVQQAILLFSTDEPSVELIKAAAHKAGYQLVSVFRYEDALEALQKDLRLRMIIVDDSVPQYEAGILLAALQRLPAGFRPLILIHDSSESEVTSRAYRAEVLLSRPLTQHALEDAIRQAEHQIAYGV